MNPDKFLNDIPQEIARAAYSGISFTPEKRADQCRENYAQNLVADYANLLKCTEGKPEMLDVLNAEFARYRDGYRARLIKKLYSDSRCISFMITGPANFPVQRNEKRNQVAHKRLTELLEFRERALAAIRKTLCPELRPIMAGDSDACSRLRENIAEAEATQERMKAVNAILRKYLKRDDAAGQAELVKIGCTEGEAKHYFTDKDCFGGYGFQSFELTNNGANIRRMKARLAGISRNQATAATEIQGEAARFEDCPADNRVRLFFPGKPDAEIRTRLKSSGFRWSPTIGCWQAYRNWSSIETAKREAGLPQNKCKLFNLFPRAPSAQGGGI